MRHGKLICGISFILSLIIFLSSCNGGGASASATVLREADIMAEDGTFLYSLIYPSTMDEESDAFEEVKNIYSQIHAAFVIKVERKNDAEAALSDDTYEILCGNTNREASKKALEELKANRENYTNDYIIRVTGKKIVIAAGSDSALVLGLRYFVENFCTNINDFSKLTDGFSYIYSPEYSIKSATIAGESLNRYTLVVPEKRSLLWSEKAEEFAENFTENAGIELKIVKDTEADETEMEILVGNTNRKESAGVTGNQYSIKLVGRKLVINGTDDIQICAAIDLLYEMQRDCIKNGKPFEIPAGYAVTGKAEKNDEDYYLAWNDEFNAKALDRTIWVDYSRNTATDDSVMGGKVYKPDARDCYLENGSLVVPAYRLSREDFQAGQATTEGTVAAMYGIIEIYAKFPEYPVTASLWGNLASYILDPVKGKVQAQREGGMELDIVENFGSENQFACNVHYWFTNEDLNFNPVSGHNSLDGGRYGTKKRFTYTEGSLAEEYHLYSVRWTPYELSFAFDGDVYFKYDLMENENTSFTASPLMFLIGASYAAPNYGPQAIEDNAPTETGLYVDYFRLYQSDQYDSVLWVTPVGSEFY